MRWPTAVGPGVSSMNTTLISALAAFGGSSVGALAPVLSSYVLQRSASQREISNRQIALREALYSDFIKEASRLYATSLTHVLESLDDLVSLYALVSRIRLFASEPVVRAAEDFVKQIVGHYGKPNLSVEQIRAAALSAEADPLDVFSFACRTELRDMLQRGTAPATMRGRLDLMAATGGGRRR